MKHENKFVLCLSTHCVRSLERYRVSMGLMRSSCWVSCRHLSKQSRRLDLSSTARTSPASAFSSLIRLSRYLHRWKNTVGGTRQNMSRVK